MNKPSPVRSADSSFAPLGSCISGIVLSCPARKEASVRKCLFFWSGQELASSRAVPLFASRNNAVASHPSTGARLFTWKNVPRIPLPGSKVRLGMEGGGARERKRGLRVWRVRELSTDHMIQGVHVTMETHLRFPNDDQEKVLDWAWKLYANSARQFIVRNCVKNRRGSTKRERITPRGLIMKGFDQNI